MSNLVEIVKDFARSAEGTPDNQKQAKEALSDLIMWIDKNCPEVKVRDVEGDSAASAPHIMFEGPKCAEQGVLVVR